MMEEGTHLRLKTESVAANSDIFAKRDRPTHGPTDTVAYRDAMDASKKGIGRIGDLKLKGTKKMGV